MNKMVRLVFLVAIIMAVGVGIWLAVNYSVSNRTKESPPLAKPMTELNSANKNNGSINLVPPPFLDE